MNQLKTGTVIKYFTLVLSNIIGIVYTPFMLRAMGQSEYGLYTLALSIVTYLSLLDFGIGAGTIRYAAFYRGEGNKDKENATYNISIQLYLFVGLLCLAVGLFMYRNIDNWYGHSLTEGELIKLQNIVLLLVIYLSFNFPLSVFTSIVTANEKFIFLQLMNLVVTILKPLAMTPLLLLGYKAFAMSCVLVTAGLIVSFSMVLYSLKNIKIKLAFWIFDNQLFKELLKFSIPLFGVMLCDVLSRSFGCFYLGTVAGAASVAIFSIAIQFRGYFEAITKVISTMMLPIFSKAIATHSASDSNNNDFFRVSRIQFHIGLFIIAVFLLYGKPFIILWAGDNYSSAYGMTVLLFLVLLLPVSESSGEELVKAYNMQRYLIIVNVTKTIVLIIFTVILSKLYSYYGTAIALAISIIVGDFVLLNYVYWKKLKLQIFTLFRQTLKIIFYVLIFSTPFVLNICYHYIEIHWSLQMVAYVMVYAILYSQLLINEEEKVLVKSLLNRINYFNK